ncbi:MAG TPA: HD domain-containing protein, partial [Polyangiaceae bacterium LLY-WYZ-15_(1-7)]|nr:HD domain-containing protein [Polyangiaceae bacterium LLY-WYZ-15_(1-7)]
LDAILRTVLESARGSTQADEVQLLLAESARDGAPAEAKALRAAMNPEAVFAHFDAGGEALRLRREEAGRYVQAGGEAPAGMLIVPLRHRGEVVGALGLSRHEGPGRFDEGQRKLVRMLAQRAATAIVNARLFRGQQVAIRETIEGLARAIDKLDPYTAGHSDRVARYAGLLARRMGLDAATVRRVRQSAQMHDIGKIGCHVNLNKPGKLTADEYEDFKKHTVYGRDILEPIGFLEPLTPGVLLHHERMDGRGYPFGIPGAEIPLIARIICIADSYDAMTSDRAYRKALSHEVAVAELKRCAGTQFDAELVPLFLEALERWRAEQGR